MLSIPPWLVSGCSLLLVLSFVAFPLTAAVGAASRATEKRTNAGGAAEVAEFGTEKARLGVHLHDIPMNVSRVYESPLPAFFFLEGTSEGSLPRAWGVAPDDTPWDVVVDDSCSDDVFTNPQQTLRDHILPHTLQ